MADDEQAHREEIFAAWQEASLERRRAEVAEIYLDRVRRLARQDTIRVEDLRDALDMP